MTTPSGTVSYLYGPDGSRLKKITSAGTTLYLSDDIERDVAGNFAFYLDPDVKLSGGVNTYLHRDPLASVVEVLRFDQAWNRRRSAAERRRRRRRHHVNADNLRSRTRADVIGHDGGQVVVAGWHVVP